MSGFTSDVRGDTVVSPDPITDETGGGCDATATTGCDGCGADGIKGIEAGVAWLNAIWFNGTLAGFGLKWINEQNHYNNLNICKQVRKYIPIC